MKTSPLVLAVFAFGFTAQALAQQPAPNPPPLVTTTGSAEIKVTPDLADLQFEVAVRNSDITAAFKEQAARAAKVLAALRAAGIAEQDLSAAQVQVSTHYPDRYADATTVQYYQVAQSFGCALHDLGKLPDVTREVLSAGATGVTPATLRTSQLRKYKDEARRKAIMAAREKAVALAAELGAKAGRPYTITEGDANSVYPYAAAAVQNNTVAVGDSESDAVSGASTFAPGMISVDATVRVSFILE